MERGKQRKYSLVKPPKYYFQLINLFPQVSMIQTLCYLLETLLTPENTPPDTAKDIYELYFVFAAIWAFGGFLFKDEVYFILIMLLYLHCHEKVALYYLRKLQGKL